MKGSGFEREVSVLLSRYLSQGKRDDLVWRTNASGARATQRHKSGKDTKFQFGDLTFTDEEAKPFFEKVCVECKTGYAKKTKSKEGTIKQTNWCALDILDSKQKKPTLLMMWNQCCRDAELSHRMPMLIFRRNMKAPCVMIAQDLFVDIVDQCNTLSKIPRILLALPSFEERLYIFKLSDFFEATENLPNIWKGK